jgi:hypothetical protein
MNLDTINKMSTKEFMEYLGKLSETMKPFRIGKRQFYQCKFLVKLIKNEEHQRTSGRIVNPLQVGKGEQNEIRNG